MLNRKNISIAVFTVTLVLMMAVTALSTQVALAQGSSSGNPPGLSTAIPNFESSSSELGLQTAPPIGEDGAVEPIDRSVPPEAVEAKKPCLFGPGNCD